MLMDHSKKDILDVIIVGAGLSGLYAAHVLAKKNVNFLVLEGRQRIAGRQWTKRDDHVSYVEMGGAYIGKTQTKIVEVVHELGLQLYPVRCDLKSTMVLKNCKLSYSSGVPLFRNPVVLIDINDTIRQLDRMSLEVPLAEPWKASKAQEWDQMSFADFIEAQTWTSTTKALCRLACLGPFLVEPQDISLLYVLHEIRACGGLISLTSVQHGLQECKVKGGSGSISEGLASKIKDRILFGEFVHAVRQDAEGIHVSSNEGKTYKAKRLILAIPLPSFSKIQFVPTLPADVALLSSIQPRGQMIKTLMFYQEQFWRNYGINGELASEEGLVSYALDDTKSDGTFPCIMGFIYAGNAKKASEKSKDERRAAICEQYAHDYGLEQFLSPVWYEEKYWQDDEEKDYSSCCCVWSLPPNVLSNVKSLPVHPHGHVFWGGTETAITFRGYMDGALRTGERAAAQVLHSLDISYPYSSHEFCTDVEYVKPSIVERHLPSVVCSVMIGFILLLFVISLTVVLLVVFTALPL